MSHQVLVKSGYYNLIGIQLIKYGAYVKSALVNSGMIAVLT